MASKQYICLACGSSFALNACGCSAGKDEEKCPHCSSANLLPLNSPSLFGFAGGGGG